MISKKTQCIENPKLIKSEKAHFGASAVHSIKYPTVQLKVPCLQTQINKKARIGENHLKGFICTGSLFHN